MGVGREHQDGQVALQPWHVSHSQQGSHLVPCSFIFFLFSFLYKVVNKTNKAAFMVAQRRLVSCLFSGLSLADND